MKLMAKLENSTDILVWKYMGTELPANSISVCNWYICVTGSDTAKQKQ